MTTVFLDTSALLWILRNRGVGPVGALTKNRRWRLVVSSEAVDELFVPDDRTLLVDAAKFLLELSSRLGAAFSFAPSARELWTKELESPVNGLQVLDGMQEGRLLQTLRLGAGSTDPVQHFASVRQSMRQWRALRSTDARALRNERGAVSLTPDEVAQLRTELVRFTLTDVPEPYFSRLLGSVTALTPARRRAIVREPRRYRAIRVWVALAYLAILGELVPPALAKEDLLFEMMKPERNDIFDAAIASAASYGALFLTNDANLVRRCGFLRNRGMVFFQAQLLEDQFQ